MFAISGIAMHEQVHIHRENINAPKQRASLFIALIFQNVIPAANNIEKTNDTGAIMRLYLSPVSTEYVYLAKSFIKFVFLIVARIGKSPIVPLVRLSAGIF